MTTRTLNLRGLVDGPLVARPVASFPPAASYPGAMALSDAGLVYASMRWPESTDPYRWVSLRELAQTVLDEAALPRITDIDLSVTVHPTNPAADFQTLGAALAFMTGYIPAAVTQGGVGTALVEISGLITILTGAILSEQIVVQSATLGWVRIVSEDDEVSVLEAGLTKSDDNYDTIPQFPFITIRNSIAPVIETKFAAVPDGLDRPTIGMTMRNASARGRRNTVTGFGPMGFVGFDVGLGMQTSQMLYFNPEITDCRTSNVRVGHRSVFSVQGATLTGGGVYGVEASLGGMAVLQECDCRRDGATEQTTDIFVQNGGYVVLRGNNPALILGGYNIQPNVATAEGLIHRQQNAPVPVLAGILDPQAYTVATLPSASANNGNFIFVSNGNSGSPCLAQSNGTNWLRIVPGAAVSSS